MLFFTALLSFLLFHIFCQLYEVTSSVSLLPNTWAFTVLWSITVFPCILKKNKNLYWLQSRFYFTSALPLQQNTSKEWPILCLTSSLVLSLKSDSFEYCPHYSIKIVLAKFASKTPCCLLGLSVAFGTDSHSLLPETIHLTFGLSPSAGFPSNSAGFSPAFC